MAKKYFSIREAIRLAESGMTRQELIEYFGLTESEYKKKFASFSEANRKRLKCLLIASGKKKKKPIEKPVILELNKNKEKVMEVWDTSYILHIANLEGDMANVIILPEVYQQLAYHERRGNGKICRLFHMILDGRAKVKLVAESFVPDNVPKDEDPADYELYEYVRQHKNTVLYTCDKSLAIKCLRANLPYKFFNRGEYGTKREGTNKKEEGLIIRRGKLFGVNPNRKDVLVFDRANRIKRMNKHFLIPVQYGDIVVCGDKTYMVLNSEGKMEEIEGKKNNRLA